MHIEHKTEDEMDRDCGGCGEGDGGFWALIAAVAALMVVWVLVVVR